MDISHVFHIAQCFINRFCCLYAILITTAVAVSSNICWTGRHTKKKCLCEKQLRTRRASRLHFARSQSFAKVSRRAIYGNEIFKKPESTWRDVSLDEGIFVSRCFDTFFFVASLCQAIVSAVCVFAQQPSNNTKTTERKLVPNNSLSDPDGYGILCAYIEIDMYTFGRYFMLRVRYVFAIISSPGGERGGRQQNEMIKCVFLCK